MTLPPIHLSFMKYVPDVVGWGKPHPINLISTIYYSSEHDTQGGV